jgi:hypothetical protein
MLERAAAKRQSLLPEVRDRVRFIREDMTRFDLGEKFPLIIVPFRPFQHLLELQEQTGCLECAGKHLAPKGRLILDFFQTDAERMHDPKYHRESLLLEYDLPDSRHVALFERVAAYHRALQRNDVEMIFDVTHADRRKQRLVMAWTLRYFFRYEVENLLARCGFELENTYGDFDASPLADHSPEMIFVATRA